MLCWRACGSPRRSAVGDGGLGRVGALQPGGEERLTVVTSILGCVRRPDPSSQFRAARSARAASCVPCAALSVLGCRPAVRDAPALRATAPRLVELTITAAPAQVALRPGTLTRVYAYNGTVPGPTLELREGDSVVVHFRNALPDPSTIHWHGLSLPFVADGSPFHPVAPGGSHDYVFRVRPGTAGTYWYHPHPDHSTGPQVAMGLYGAVVVRAPDDPLPRTLRERLLVLSDTRLTADGVIDLPDHDTPRGQLDAENGREGDLLLVNGATMPTFDIRSGEVQRWRVINASAARVYRLALPGHRFLHVGSDGGLFEHPREVDDLVLGVGERAELLVRGTGAAGSREVLRTLGYDRYIPQTRPADWDVPRDLLTLAYASAPPVVPPGTAGTYWYHPHPHHRTGDQVARGLYGAIVVRAPDDPLPASLRELSLIHI